jgi:hypothetical protein
MADNRAMLFIEWWLVRRFAFGLIVVAAGIAGLFIRIRSGALRIFLRIFSVPVVLAGALSLLLQWTAIGCQSYSGPVFSPNGKMAVRVSTADLGGLGGSSAVELYAEHGFITDTAFAGEFASVDPAGIQWRGDSELDVFYRGKPYLCQDVYHVKVHCIHRGQW